MSKVILAVNGTVQFKMASLCLEKPICALPHLQKFP